MKRLTGRFFRPGPAADDTQVTFRRELSREILLGERRLATVLAAIYSLLLVLFLVYATFFTGRLPDLLHVELPVYNISILLALAAVYELLIWSIFGLVFKARRRLPLFLRYFNTLIEISFLTGAIVVVAETLDPVYALLTPVTMLYFLFITLTALGLDFTLCLFAGAVAAAEYALLTWFYIARVSDLALVNPALLLLPHHLGKALVLFLAGIVTGFVTLQIKRRVINSLRMVAERNRVINIFGQHVAPEIVDQILGQKSATIEGEARYVCVMILDIRGFTSFAEEREPKEVVEYLNTLFDLMVEIVNHNHGVIFKFLGDGFLAVFGAPFATDNSRRYAVDAALEIISTVREKSDAGAIPPTLVGIGIHAGNAVTGNIGSATRKEYTVIGDMVNLTSRIEQLNKQFRSQLLVSDEVWQAVKASHPNAVALGPIPVPGRTDPVDLFRLV